MNFLLSHLDEPWVQWTVGLAVFFFLYQAVAPRISVNVPVISLDRVLGTVLGPSYARAKTERAARRLLGQGNYLAAGRVFEESGRDDEAVQAYLQGSEMTAAAAVLERQRKLDRAAELYLQAGEHKRAAQLLVDAGRPAKAAALMESKGSNLDAARLYAQAGQWDKAADLYAKAGFALRAAEAFEQAGELRRAAECHERHFMENVSYGSTYSSTAASPDQKSALAAGRLYEQAGDLDAAARILSRGGFLAEAARVSLALGAFEQAAEWFLRAEDLSSAADAYERAGEAEKAANYRGEAAYKAGELERAAALFQQARDYQRSAELFEQIGQLEHAAAAFEAGENFAAAGSVYVRAGQKARAAAAYERAGDHETAGRLYEAAGLADKSAELFERAGLTFKSGLAAAAAGDRERAIALLQRVPATDEHYREASERLAELLIEVSRAPLAVERLRKAVDAAGAPREALGLQYWLARALEAVGQPGEAAALYRTILADDLHFRDAEIRLAGAAAAAATGGRDARLTPDTTWPPASSPAYAVGSGPVAAEPSQASWPPAGRAPAPPAAGRFADHREIGRGPLGVVYRARDVKRDRFVALRALSPGLSPQTYRELVNDLRQAAAVGHPNLVRVLGAFESGGQRYAVTELVEGPSCAGPLKAGRRMPPGQAVGLGLVLADALAAVHAHRLAHGSILPSNVVLASGVFRLTDLGLARLVRQTHAGSPYRPPEGGFDAEADLFAVVALLYHLVTGRLPGALPARPPGALVSGVPEELDQVVFRGLHPEPEVRFATTAELATALGRVAG